jgi:thiamine-phosphate pyrophosphorylase
MYRSPEGLHVIVHTQVEPFVLEEIIAAEPAIIVIQLRDKDATLDQIAEYGTKIKQQVAGSGILFAVNDHVSTAIKIGADIVHVGQNDMPADKVGESLPDDMQFGVSATTISEAQFAERHGASYIGYGPVYQSNVTKPDTIPVGLEGLSVVSSALGIPVIAIGGINQANAELVMKNKAGGLAVAGEVIRSSDPRGKASALQRIIYQYKKI